MPDTELTQMAKLDEKAIIAGIAVENSKKVDIFTEKEKERFDKLFEEDRLMCKNIFLNEKDLTKKIGVIRGDHFSVGMWNNFAAIYTVGSNDSSCGITFETRDKNSDNTVERMRIDAAGNVGIGTLSPGDKLDIFGTVRLYGKNAFQGGDSFLRINQDNAFPSGTHFNYRANFYRGITTGTWWDVEPGPGNLLVQGNVGIGTTSPSAKLEVSGDVKAHDVFLVGGDCAEDFDISEVESVQPGTVMVIGSDGVLRASEQAYDKRVAGVISGAGDLRPGITLDRQRERTGRLPLALNGKVYCKVDAEYKPVEVGDLLTTSSTIGYAMKADDHEKAFGAIIGKALHELDDGKGLIPILVALQ